ncbi:MAG: methionine--tRNA ligase [Bacteriovorax sp.]|nr:methionine--tRNA ligase [Bacteriovorax sp.]
MTEKFYITTAIDYPNGIPHMGHALEKVISDAYNRWHKFLGFETYFVTGTDENGQKLLEAAKAAGIPTQEYVDTNSAKFKKLSHDLNVSNDDFIRTTEKRHIDVCNELWTKLEKKGDVYFGVYSGQYCLACESFYTETQAPDNICPAHNTTLVKKEEEGYFFKMSSYQEWIISYIKTHPTFIVPQSSYNEMLSRLEGDKLRDLPISRPNENWGIPVPGNPKFVMYTWFDALINYYAAVAHTDKEKFWPASMHVIGKDITWFHTVIWPIMLHAADIAIPKQVYVHGMILAEDGKKMSKSLGNVVDPNDMLAKYPLDSFRYYLLRAIPAQNDGRFSEKELIEKQNAELGNSYGNLIMRVLKLYLKDNAPTLDGTGVTQEVNFDDCFKKMKEYMEKREHNRALEVLWEGVNSMNQYVNIKEPWKLKEDKVALKQVVYNCVYSIHALSTLLSPFLPDTALKALQPLGVQLGRFEDVKFGTTTYELTEPTPLFPKIDLPEAPKPEPKAPKPPKAPKVAKPEMA